MNPPTYARLSALNPSKLSLYLIVFISLWHLALAPFFDLTIDEAHYALYGLKPALSYFDHPPLVGWIQTTFVTLIPTDFGARLAPVLLMAVLSYLVFQLAIQLFKDKWVGFWSLVFLNFNLMFQMLGLALLPELPFVIFSLLSILIVLQMRESNYPPTYKQWILLGIALGLAGLAKYTAFLLIVSLGLLVILERRWNWIFSWKILAGIVVALLVISPVILWNMQNNWASLDYQLNHTMGATSWEFSRFISGIGTQILTYSPLVYFLGLGLIFLGWRANPAYRIPILFALPVILFISYNSGFKRALPHWVALVFVIMLPVLVHFIKTHWSKTWLRILVYSNTLLSLGLILLLNFVIVFQWLPETDRKNSVRQIFGWQAAVDKALELQQDYPEAKFFVNNWTHASRVAWYAYPQEVFITRPKLTQYDYWFGKAQQGATGLAIIPSYDRRAPAGRGVYSFETCQELDELSYAPQGKEIAHFNFYLCTNYQAN